MNTRELTCICCPLGCALKVAFKNNKITRVSGNNCKRGDVYARKEVTNPTRIVTSTVRVIGGSHPMVNVKTESDIPKEKIAACMEALKGIEVKAPVRIGDVILSNVADTNVNIIAARNVI